MRWETVDTGEKVIVGGGLIAKVNEVINGIVEEGTESVLEPVANVDRIWESWVVVRDWDDAPASSC